MASDAVFGDGARGDRAISDSGMPGQRPDLDKEHSEEKTVTFADPVDDTAGDDADNGHTRDLNSESMMLLNNIISNARGAGVDGDKWKAPVVLCMGPQSAGKSSLIWRLTGLPMPRDSTMCTKCPQEIRMNFADSFRCQIRIRREYDDYFNKLDEVDERPFGDPFTNLTEFHVQVKAASDSIVPGRSFSLTMLIVDVEGPNFPPINIVDMPGKVQAGFPKRIVEINNRMYREYMARDECIMIVLHQSMNNFENNDVYAFAKQYDPNGMRTIGILTKPDKIQHMGEQDNAWEVLKNDSTAQSYFPHGWFCVMNPVQDEQEKYKIPTQFDRVENKYFGTDKIWSKSSGKIKKQLGFDAALQKLLEFYHKQAQKSLPALEGLAKQAKIASEKQLEMLPKADDKPEFTVNKLIQDLALELRDHQHGYVAKKQGLWNAIMETSRDIEFICDASKPRFKFLNDMTEKDMDRVPEKYRALFEVHTKDDVYCKMEEFRGRDVSLEINADRMIEVYYLEVWERRKGPLKDSVRELMDQVLEVVQSACIEKTFGAYPTFKERIGALLHSVVANNHSDMESDIDELTLDFQTIFRVRVNPQQHYNVLTQSLLKQDDAGTKFGARGTYLLIRGEHIEFRPDRASSWKRARVVQVSADGTKARIKYRSNGQDHIKWIHVVADLVRRSANATNQNGGLGLDEAKKQTKWRIDYDNGREWYWNKETQEKAIEKPAIFQENPKLYIALASEKAPPSILQQLKSQAQAQSAMATTVDTESRTFLLDPSNPIEARIGQVTAAVRAYIEERDKAFLHTLGNRLVRRFIRELDTLITDCMQEFMNCGESAANTLLSIDSSQEQLRIKLQDKVKKLQKVSKQLQKFRSFK